MERRHAAAVQAVRDALSDFFESGRLPEPDTRAAFRYPELRVTYAPLGASLPTRRAFAKFPTPGVYRTTVDAAVEISHLSARTIASADRRIRRDAGGRAERAGDPLPLRVRTRRRTVSGGARAAPNWCAIFRFHCSRRWVTKSPTALWDFKTRRHAPAGAFSTPSASIIRCGASFITPAPTGDPSSRGSCSRIIIGMSINSSTGASSRFGARGPTAPSSCRAASRSTRR